MPPVGTHNHSNEEGNVIQEARTKTWQVHLKESLPRGSPDYCTCKVPKLVELWSNLGPKSHLCVSLSLSLSLSLSRSLALSLSPSFSASFSFTCAAAIMPCYHHHRLASLPPARLSWPPCQANVQLSTHVTQILTDLSCNLQLPRDVKNSQPVSNANVWFQKEEAANDKQWGSVGSSSGLILFPW